MLGAIAGDIAGSVYEWHNIKKKDFNLFEGGCSFTDDTVMTCAVAEAVMSGGKRDDFIDSMKKYGRMFPDAGYGGRFYSWIMSNTRMAYGSFGNGSAMRVSPCAWAVGIAGDREAQTAAVRSAARLSAEVTHNHPEGIKGAMATAEAIFICRLVTEDCRFDANKSSLCKRLVKEKIEREYGYDLSKTLDEIRPSYSYDVSCMGSVPQAVIAFLESTDFEDALRNAISLGGDSDTIAAISGSIAEAAYGIPKKTKDTVCSFLDPRLLSVLKRWEKFLTGK